MSKTLYPCNECDGTGHYTIYNAYDTNFKEEIVCEYCGGTGYVERNVEVPIVKVDVAGKDLN